MAQHRGKGDVRIGRMHDDLADLSFLLPNVSPGFAGISRLVDAVAGRHISANVGLARADVNDIRIGRRHSDGTDGRNGLLVENGFPGEAGVGGLPHAAGGRSRIADHRITAYARGTRHSSSGRGTDRAIFDELEFRRPTLIRLRFLFFRGCGDTPNQQSEDDCERFSHLESLLL